MSEDLLDCLVSSVAKEINLFENALTGLNVDSSAAKCDISSVVHSGDTDSSDDEENCKLNESGKTIKTLLSTSDSIVSKEVTKTWLNRPVGISKTSAKVEPSKAIFGVRVINPLIPSNVIEERISKREVVEFNRLKFFIDHIPADKDWVVAGAIIQKTVKTSKNGKKYCMWTLSDLKPDLKSAVVFLFGSAYKELWKISVGMVVGILNPNIFERRDGAKEEACFNVDNHQKVMVVGQSRDYGICKSMKKNGERCTAFVNKSTCEFCLYHVKQEYQQFSKRSVLQSSFSNGGGRLTALRNKVLGKDQVFYAGKLYTAIKPPKHVAKDKGRLQSLNGIQQKSRTIKKTRLKQAARLDVTVGQRMRDLQLLKQLGGSLNSERTVFNAEVSREVTIEESKNTALKLKSMHETPNVPKIFDKTLLQPQNGTIDLNINFPKMSNIVGVPKLSKKAVCAKQNAIKWIQANGSIKKVDPNNTRGSENPRKRPLENSETPVPTLKINKMQENQFISDRFKKMMAATSSHVDLVENYEHEQVEKYFNKQEMKERLEEKMLTTYKMPCKAVKCLKCKYTSFSASDLCKSERHPLKVYDAIKRFFKCGNCGNRTVCLEVVPTTSCKNCGLSKWERTGMMKERKVEIGAPQLSIRGGEQKFVNSVITDANLNLMVPDE